MCSLRGLKFGATFEEACVSYTLALATDLNKIYSVCSCSCWPSTPPERSSGWSAHRRHLCSGKDRQGRSSESWMFAGADLVSQILASLYTSKSTQVLHGDECSS